MQGGAGSASPCTPLHPSAHPASPCIPIASPRIPLHPQCISLHPLYPLTSPCIPLYPPCTPLHPLHLTCTPFTPLQIICYPPFIFYLSLIKYIYLKNFRSRLLLPPSGDNQSCQKKYQQAHKQGWGSGWNLSTMNHSLTLENEFWGTMEIFFPFFYFWIPKTILPIWRKRGIYRIWNQYIILSYGTVHPGKMVSSDHSLQAGLWALWLRSWTFPLDGKAVGIQHDRIFPK